MITIDGSQGEGGGQILRTSLALSAITGTPVRIERIRARRPKPGLQRQHLVAVQAAARVCNGHLDGAELHSREIVLTPQAPCDGTYEFDIGSAGSTTLVLQTVLPILLCADGPSQLRIRGGTHNPMAPPVEFLQESFLPVLHRIGIAATLDLARHGFYPAGGGAISAGIQPWQARVPLQLHERGKAIGRHAEVLLANLPAHVASREAQALKHGLHWSHAEVDEREVAADGPGNAIIARLRHAAITTVITAVGELRKPAEQVAQDCVRQVQRHLQGDAPVCQHLADQLLLPLAIGAGGSFRTVAPSEHTRTNAAIIAAFLGPVVDIAEQGGCAVVSVRGRQAQAG
ncbi:MAG: RNA 3'-terminal phosphate cyclase [Planctomycetes bacterium]|nr:RNA 3'-terminal phosphate cyclase [Planctomycetota bacterium]